MSDTAFLYALDFVLAEEGGYIDHPKDTGGATYAGISLRAVVGLKAEDGHLKFDLDSDGDVDTDDIKRLSEIGKTEQGRSLICTFYRTHYWTRAQCDLLPWPLSLCVFDAAVNHGTRPAVVLLQRALGVEPDGLAGPETLRAIGSGRYSVPAMVRRYLTERAFLYHRISIKQGHDDFIRGWMKRCFDLQAECLRPVRP